MLSLAINSYSGLVTVRFVRKDVKVASSRKKKMHNSGQTKINIRICFQCNQVITIIDRKPISKQRRHTHKILQSENQTSSFPLIADKTRDELEYTDVFIDYLLIQSFKLITIVIILLIRFDTLNI